MEVMQGNIIELDDELFVQKHDENLMGDLEHYEREKNPNDTSFDDELSLNPILHNFNGPSVAAKDACNSSEVIDGSPQASLDAHSSQKSEEEIVFSKELGSFDVVLAMDESKQVDKQSPTPRFFFEELSHKFTVVEKVGEGTFSTVYKGISEHDGHEYALKRINATCSPERILSEIKFLYQYGGRCNVAALFAVERCRDQVALILPYIKHQKFKDYMPNMTIEQIKSYMRALFIALEHLHTYKIMHRDLKPGNFLVDSEQNKYLLVDFGLAQKQEDFVETSIQKQNYLIANPISLKRKISDPTEMLYRTNKRVKRVTQTASINRTTSYKFPRNERTKKSLKAPRGGTRGFRAPEVLLRCLNQTVAIDIWSAGVILLSILSTRYPFFNAPDDLVSLTEIAAIFGTKRLKEVALSLNRRVNFPTEIPKSDLKSMCQILSSRKMEIPDSAYDLLESCLEIDPKKRITASDALRHPFLVRQIIELNPRNSNSQFCKLMS